MQMALDIFETFRFRYNLILNWQLRFSFVYKLN